MRPALTADVENGFHHQPGCRIIYRLHLDVGSKRHTYSSLEKKNTVDTIQINDCLYETGA